MAAGDPDCTVTEYPFRPEWGCWMGHGEAPTFRARLGQSQSQGLRGLRFPCLPPRGLHALPLAGSVWDCQGAVCMRVSRVGVLTSTFIKNVRLLHCQKQTSLVCFPMYPADNSNNNYYQQNAFFYLWKAVWPHHCWGLPMAPQRPPHKAAPCPLPALLPHLPS